MPITRLGAAGSAAGGEPLVSPVTLTHAVGAGTDRMLVVGLGQEATNPATTVTSVDYGGQAMTKAIENPFEGASIAETASIWFILDAGIAANTDDVITPTFSGARNDESVHAQAYENVDQTGGSTTNPSTNSDGNEAGANPLTGIDLTETDGGLIVATGLMGNTTAGATSWSAPMNLLTDFNETSSRNSMADRLSITNANVDIEATWAATYNRQSMVSAKFAEVSAAAVTLLGAGIL
jgi:hypothetical protein